MAAGDVRSGRTRLPRQDTSVTVGDVHDGRRCPQVTGEFMETRRGTFVSRRGERRVASQWRQWRQLGQSPLVVAPPLHIVGL